VQQFQSLENVTVRAWSRTTLAMLKGKETWTLTFFTRWKSFRKIVKRTSPLYCPYRRMGTWWTVNAIKHRRAALRDTLNH
jgi:hypothetical protein